jgi:hypothetical protein
MIASLTQADYTAPSQGLLLPEIVWFGSDPSVQVYNVYTLTSTE